MKEEPIIRFAQSSDLTDIVELCRQHALFEKNTYDPTHKKHQLANHLFAEKPSLYCLVVVQAGKLIGYATYMLQFSTWDAAFYVYMDCLFLTDGSRGYGIGEKLIARIKEEGRKNGCDHIQWQTPEFNERAIKFYHRIGGKSKSKERFFLDC